MRITLPAALVAASLALTACGSSADTTPEPTAAPTTSGSTSSAPAATGQVVEVSVKDGKVTPSGTTVPVKVGKTITLRVTADAAGELHVHSDPEHELAYKAGVTTLDFTINRPGVVEVEDHTTDALVVNLEAR
jgi:hypothetical protein